MTIHHPQVFRFPFRIDNAVEVQANLEHDGLITLEIVANINQKIVHNLIRLGGRVLRSFVVCVITIFKLSMVSLKERGCWIIGCTIKSYRRLPFRIT